MSRDQREKNEERKAAGPYVIEEFGGRQHIFDPETCCACTPQSHGGAEFKVKGVKYRVIIDTYPPRCGSCKLPLFVLRWL